MGLARDLLHAAAGEIPLRSARGRFFQTVSEIVDALDAIVSQKRWVQTFRSGVPQVLLVPNSVIVMNAVARSEGVPYDPSFGTYSLRAGRLYSLEFYGAFTNFTTPTAYVEYGWFHSGTEISPLCRGFAYAGDTVAGESTQPVAKVLYRPDSDQSVLVGVITLVDPVSVRQGSYAIVEEIG